MKFEEVTPFCFVFRTGTWKIFMKTHSIESRTGKYTVCRLVLAYYSPEILQTGAMKGLMGNAKQHEWHNYNLRFKGRLFQNEGTREGCLVFCCKSIYYWLTVTLWQASDGLEAGISSFFPVEDYNQRVVEHWTKYRQLTNQTEEGHWRREEREADILTAD